MNLTKKHKNDIVCIIISCIRLFTRLNILFLDSFCFLQDNCSHWQNLQYWIHFLVLGNVVESELLSKSAASIFHPDTWCTRFVQNLPKTIALECKTNLQSWVLPGYLLSTDLKIQNDIRKTNYIFCFASIVTF